jgi:hypothetical protein
MGRLFKAFRLFGETPTIFLEIFFNFLNGFGLFWMFFLIWGSVGIFHEFFFFEGILKKLDSIVKVDVNSFHGLKLIFEFEDFLMEKFFFQKPFFLLDG